MRTAVSWGPQRHESPTPRDGSLIVDDDRHFAVPPQLSSRAQLSDEVGSYLRDLIMSGQLVGGQYVRVDRVAETLGVSTTPVREALLSLRAEGFVELVPRKGFVVAPLSGADVRDLFLAQANLAGELAARAAVAIDEFALTRLRGLQANLSAAAISHNLDAIEQENYRFHREINQAAGAPKLMWLLRVVVRYTPRRFYAAIEGWPQASVEDHAGILEALEAGDPERSRQAMNAHIVHAGDLLASHFERGQVLGSPTKQIVPR
jgi:DNA-binding GntR family transcriptional regulator